MSLWAFKRVNREVDELIEAGHNAHERGEYIRSIQNFKDAREIIDDLNPGRRKRPQTAAARLQRDATPAKKRFVPPSYAPLEGAERKNISFLSPSKIRSAKTKLKLLPVIDSESEGRVTRLKHLKSNMLPIQSVNESKCEDLSKIFANRAWRKELQLKSAAAQSAEAALELNKAEHEKAEKLLFKVLKQQQNLMAEENVRNHPIIACTLHNLGCLRSSQARVQEAESFFMRALQMRKACYRLNEEHLDIAESLNDLGCCRLTLGRPGSDCENDLLRGLHMRQSLLPKTHSLITESMCNVSLCAFKMGQRGRALKLMKEALHLRRRSGDLAGTIDCSIMLADMYGRDVHLYGKALALLRESLGMLQDVKEDDHYGFASIMHKIARLHFANMKYDKAKSWAERAIGMCNTKSSSLTRAYIFAIEMDLKLIDARLEAKRLYQERLDLAKRLAEGWAEPEKKIKRRRKKRRHKRRGRRSASPERKRSLSPNRNRRKKSKSPPRKKKQRPRTAHRFASLKGHRSSSMQKRPKTALSRMQRMKIQQTLTPKGSEILEEPSRNLSSWGSSFSSLPSAKNEPIRKKKKIVSKESRFAKDSAIAAARYKKAEVKRAEEEKRKQKRLEREEGLNRKSLNYIIKANNKNMKSVSQGGGMFLSGPPIGFKSSFVGNAQSLSESVLQQW